MHAHGNEGMGRRKEGAGQATAADTGATQASILFGVVVPMCFAGIPEGDFEPGGTHHRLLRIPRQLPAIRDRAEENASNVPNNYFTGNGKDKEEEHNSNDNNTMHTIYNHNWGDTYTPTQDPGTPGANALGVGATGDTDSEIICGSTTKVDQLLKGPDVPAANEALATPLGPTGSRMEVDKRVISGLATTHAPGRRSGGATVGHGDNRNMSGDGSMVDRSNVLGRTVHVGEGAGNQPSTRSSQNNDIPRTSGTLASTVEQTISRSHSHHTVTNNAPTSTILGGTPSICTRPTDVRCSATHNGKLIFDTRRHIPGNCLHTGKGDTVHWAIQPALGNASQRNSNEFGTTAADFEGTPVSHEDQWDGCTPVSRHEYHCGDGVGCHSSPTKKAWYPGYQGHPTWWFDGDGVEGVSRGEDLAFQQTSFEGYATPLPGTRNLLHSGSGDVCRNVERGEQLTLPLHVKHVTRWNEEAITALVGQFEDLKSAYLQLRAITDCRQNEVPPQLLHEADVQDEDIARLLENDIIVETWNFAPSVGAVRVFTVIETAKVRRRAIFWPKLLNASISDEVKSIMKTVPGLWPSHEHLVGAVLSGRFAVLADAKAFYHQIPCQVDYRFVHSGRAYSLLTIPTGVSNAPAIAQLVLTAVGREVHRRVKRQGHLTAFVDNIRFVCASKKEAELTLRILNSVCVELGITLNEDECVVAEQYTFLGVKFDHVRAEVSMGDRFVEKLRTVNIRDISLRDCQALFSRLCLAASILQLETARFYYCYKFMRRREHSLGGPKTWPLTPAEVWKSTWSLWNTWLHEASTVRRKVKSVDDHHGGHQPMNVMYTDASKSGWGAIIFMGTAVHIAAGPWQAAESRPIHLLEAHAVQLALGAFAPRLVVDPNPITINIDNTTVIGALVARRSRQYLLNCFIRRIREHPVFPKIAIIQYVHTKMNKADVFSRLYETPDSALFSGATTVS